MGCRNKVGGMLGLGYMFHCTQDHCILWDVREFEYARLTRGKMSSKYRSTALLAKYRTNHTR